MTFYYLECLALFVLLNQVLRFIFQINALVHQVNEHQSFTILINFFNMSFNHDLISKDNRTLGT